MGAEIRVRAEPMYDAENVGRKVLRREEDIVGDDESGWRAIRVRTYFEGNGYEEALFPFKWVRLE